jgi:two-component system phosphate regulon response regulator PhoB
MMKFAEATSKTGWRDLIYIVEDDQDLSQLIGHNLNAAGYDVSKFLSGANVIQSAEMNPPSLFLLDIMMPGINGFDLCRQIRQHDRLLVTPIIFLSTRTDENDRLQAFDAGADAYMTKPFSPRELIARIRNIIRIQKLVPGKDILRVADIEMNLASMTLRVGGTTIPTTVREFRLLEYMVRNRGHVFTRDQLLDAVWKDGCFVTPRSIDVFVRRLREKIESDPRHPYYLKTHRGIGYRFEATN